MKSLQLALLLILAIFFSARGEDARFFRIAGPVATTITAFSADGYMTWTNALTNATFTVQTARYLQSESNWVDYIQVPVTNPLTIHRLYDPNPPTGMVLIPAGSFTMGDTFDESDGEGLPLHTVNVSAFYMDRYEVTKALWDEVHQWATNHGYSFDNLGAWDNGVNYSKGSNHPVHLINWFDMVKWCNARSEKENKMPAYFTDVGLSLRYKIGQVSPYVNWISGYRLPTEAEWEKAGRGGLRGRRFPWADTDNIGHSRANYYSHASYDYDTSTTRGYHPAFATGGFPYTSPVGYFAANGYGLYDMAGNMWEWCWDWHAGNYYASSPGNDPRGPSSGFNRVLRGGNWGNVWGDYAFCGTGLRNGSFPTDKALGFGFRSVLPTTQ